MSKETKFILLQGSVVFNRQIGLFDVYEHTSEGRNKAFRKVIDALKEKGIVRISIKNVEYLLLYKLAINQDLIYCQLAKRTKVETYNLENNNIKQEQLDSYPPLDVFIDLTKQQFAVELNNIISEEAISNILFRLLKNFTKEFDVFVNAIQNTNEFWDLIQDDDEIKEITFDLIVPNLFNATGAADALVSEARDELNADNVQLSFINTRGKLKAKLETIDSYVRYSSATGAWKLKIKSNKETKYRIIKSTDCCLKKFIETEIIDLVKKMDSSGSVETRIYQALVARIEGLFDDEE